MNWSAIEYLGGYLEDNDVISHLIIANFIAALDICHNNA